jgi:hypothetical protein
MVNDARRARRVTNGSYQHRLRHGILAGGCHYSLEVIPVNDEWWWEVLGYVLSIAFLFPLVVLGLMAWGGMIVR